MLFHIPKLSLVWHGMFFEDCNLYIISCVDILSLNEEIMCVTSGKDVDNLSIKMQSYQLKNFRYKDKMVSRLSYLHNENPQTLKDGLYIKMGPWIHLTMPKSTVAYTC